MTTQQTFVLVHGGWQAGRSWDLLRDVLRGQGHDVLVPSWLNAPGEEPPSGGATSIDGAGDSVARQVLDAAGSISQGLVLVGHSGGGPVSQRAAETLGEQVERLVFLDAWVVHDGECLLDLLPAAADFEPVAAARDDRSVPLPLELWCERYINGAPRDVATAWA